MRYHNNRYNFNNPPAPTVIDVHQPPQTITQDNAVNFVIAIQLRWPEEKIYSSLLLILKVFRRSVLDEMNF